jgi:hypothetical protein
MEMRNLKWSDAPTADANNDSLDDETRRNAISNCLFDTELQTKSDLENMADFLRNANLMDIEWETATLANGAGINVNFTDDYIVAVEDTGFIYVLHFDSTTYPYRVDKYTLDGDIL